MMYRKAALLALLTLGLVSSPAIADVAEDLAKAENYLQAEDYKRAYKSFKSLAKEGSYRSQFVLAGLLAEGKGAKQDVIEGYAWSVLAAESKNAEYMAYSEELLAGIEDREKANYEAEKLRDKYGAQAQFERAQRLALRNMSRGECTGSRLSCGNTQIYSTPMTENQQAPGGVATEGGN